MAWEQLKQDLLAQLSQRIDQRSDAQHRQSLHRLASTFYQRFAAEDMRQRSVENLYGFLYGLLRFMQRRTDAEPRVRIFNPDIETHGWESKYTTVVVLCEDMPFCTASVRGELNRRNIHVHTVTSCNIRCLRNAEGELESLLDAEQSADNVDDQVSAQSVLYFEISRHSNLEDLEELRLTLADILREVAVVVDDFSAMRERLRAVQSIVQNSHCIDTRWRDEAEAFVGWLEHNHMTFLGYECLRVERRQGQFEVMVDAEKSLGSLRHRTTRGAVDLLEDLHSYDTQSLRRRQLSFSKSRQRSCVHRLAYPDYVEVKEYDAAGEVVAQHRFIGLYTSSVYTMDPKSIPILRRKVARVLELSGLDSAEHDARELARVLELYPRDELFQSNTKQLFETASAINRIQERRHTRLFVRGDVHGKFINCLVYVPRDTYTTELRCELEGILCRAFAAEESEFTTLFSESILVRCHFVLRVNPARANTYDIHEIEEQIVQATLAWEDRLRNLLVEEFGEEQGEGLCRELGAGFPPGYRDDFDPRVAVLDIRNIQQLIGGEELAMSLYRMVEESGEMLRLRLYHRGASLPLSDVLPILENLGLRVVAERPYGVRAAAGDHYWIQEFSLIYSLSMDFNLDQVKDEFEDAFSRIWFGEAESDSFNRLLIGTRLNWREIALLRAYARYLKQINFPFSVDYIAETMANHLHIAADIVEYFLTRFSPVFDGDEDWRQQREEAVCERVLASLDQVQNLGEDRIIRQYLTLIAATLRTNFFQHDEAGKLKPYFSFKLSPAAIPEVPQPVPMFEIFVYSPRVEGVHLRGGKVARGGLRWSDRLEDFRTEVLGLVKAQQVKNAVIVPVGAKGGFVAKQIKPEMSRDQAQQEAVACYSLFIRGLLDLTDNRIEGAVVTPPMVVAKDEEDPYLVVAADKGTATFSDIANELAAQYSFWLGDAFASGGSVGYDHKKMGITAKGAWVSVQRHFREMGVDVQRSEFSVVGIGDMAGDVFGNGMLLSQHIQLLAAFNHMHIFIDPQPNCAASFAERQRLFDLPRSSWADYDTSLISEGGGIFERRAKSISLSPQIRQRFAIEEQHLSPDELIVRLLCAEVDLLWNGGIGTYVKASTELHIDVGDKANDALRVDANALRCKVIGEGGNLGMTQLARIEYGLGGGRSNTDFIDNAAGVDCSDHEVNIKILLNAIVERGDLSAKQRNKLLEDMTDDVAELVLQNNYRQVQAISLTEFQNIDRSGEYRGFITTLEEGGRLSRALEFIPSDEELADRSVQGKGLSRPELSVLVSYSKGILKEQLIDSDLGKDPYLAHASLTAFPQQLVTAYRDDILEHDLHREIMCTQIANDIVNRMGLNFILRQRKATGAPVEDVARAYTTVMEVFELAALWRDVEALDHQVSSAVQIEMMLIVIRLVKRAVRWLLRNRRHELAPTGNIAEFAKGVSQLRLVMPDVLRGRAQEQYQQSLSGFIELGVESPLAQRVAICIHAYTSLGIIQAAQETQADVEAVAALYYALGERLELDWFAGQILATKVDNEWQAMARDTYMEDLEWQQRTLAVGALKHICADGDMEACLQKWEEQEAPLLGRWREMLTELHGTNSPDFAMFAVANRELLDLAQSSLRA